MPRESIYKSYKPAVRPEPGGSSPGYWFIFRSNALLVEGGGGRAGIPRLADPGELNLSPLRTQYLGTLQGCPCYSAEVPAEAAAPEGMSFAELRPLYAALEEDIFLLAGKALQIVNWDRTHQYCGACGQRTETLPDERAKKCPACGLTSFPRLSPAVIMGVVKDNEILLTHNASFQGNRYSIIAGFVEPGETLEECVKREIREEVGLEVKNVRYFGSQPWPFPDSLMIGFTAGWESGEIAVDGREISDAGWYDARNLPEIPSGVSIAREIIDWCLNPRAGDISAKA
jgi:NAD+ diphosphatase